MTEYYSHGKLLISSEYAVLDGVKALAVPTRFGQSLKVKSVSESGLFWNSFDEKGQLWFEAQFQLNGSQLDIKFASDMQIAERLTDILKIATELSAHTKDLNGLSVETHLEFHRQWGLGSSSTLINNIANWFAIDAYALLGRTFGGSGYDIACAQHSSPIIYKVTGGPPEVSEVVLDWPFKEHLYFVYLNKKQDSRSGISDYRKRTAISEKQKGALNAITTNFTNVKDLDNFEALIQEHNILISELIGQPPLSQNLFKDFQGTIKNLGAWGGDFILVASQEPPEAYFKSKGFDTIIPYAKMIL
jgi:mevalonate kinase